MAGTVTLPRQAPTTPGELASAVGVAEPIVREWLANQAVGGYVEHDPVTGRFTMSEEQVAVFADPPSPTSLTAAFDLACAYAREEPRRSSAFSAGGGFGWHEHIQEVFS
ncbi:MAG: SAM-dependent methyltransferase, partial [Actinobacteria bacterium]|nr:SAM-dependent methyltransferase [Actinomycetota bacterium]